MLNETERRRADFAGGAPVKMADGQEWVLAKPLIQFAYSAGPLGFNVVLNITEGDNFNNLMQSVDTALEAGNGDQIVGSQLAIGAALLRRNYDLTDEEMGTLLRFAYGETDGIEANERRLNVMDIARGNGLKVKEGTSESQ